MRTQTPAPSPNTFTKTDGDRRGYWLALCQDVVKVLAGNAEERSDLGLAPAGRVDHFTHQFTGMGRAPVRIALSGIFGHGFASHLLLAPVDDARGLDAGFEFLGERAEGEGHDFRR